MPPSAVDIKKTLEKNISEETLHLAQDSLPGPFQEALGDYLNGITLPLGESGYLKVAGGGAHLALEMSPVKLNAGASASQATVTVEGTGSAAGSSIKAGFAKQDSDVVLTLDATMGDKLIWRIDELWPSILDRAPFTELTLAQGSLQLSYDAGTIDFKGSGTLNYRGSALVSSAIRVVREKPAAEAVAAPSIAFLAGVVVTRWSPGTLFRPLEVLTFKDSGLFFVSSSSAAAKLTDLVPAKEVPALLDSSFKLTEGVSFFTTLELTSGPVRPLREIFGEVDLSLFANSSDAGDASILAHLAVDVTTKAFKFAGLSLSWDLESENQYSVTASTGGTFHISHEQTLTFSLAGSIQSDGTLSFKLAIDDWKAPFGYKRLEVKNFYIDIEAGGGGGGVTLVLGGAFQFTSEGRDPNTFVFGVAGAITDFEVPSGIAMSLEEGSPGQVLTLGEAIDGITTIEASRIPVIEIIDEILQIKKIEVWAVEVDHVVIGHKTYSKGFGFCGDVILLGEEVVLAVDVEETAEPSFSGKAEMVEAIHFGDVLCLERSATEKDKGPLARLSSKVSDEQPYYFFLSAHVGFLDAFAADLFAEATDDGFQFIYKVKVGDKHPGGAWASRQISVLVDAKKLVFGASFSFDFGMHDVTLGPLVVDGIKLIPAVHLPNFDLGASFKIGADLDSLKFTLDAALKFEFLSADWDPSMSLTLDLGSAPATVSGLGEQALAWIEGHLEEIIGGVWKDFDRFLSWVRENFAVFANQAVELAQFIAQTFGKPADEVASALRTIGFDASQVTKALVDGLGIALDEAMSIVNDVFGSCAATTATREM
ncbi:MAG: hypothetical protein AAGC60_19560 [Acidobacteriota bacterium]